MLGLFWCERKTSLITGEDHLAVIAGGSLGSGPVEVSAKSSRGLRWVCFWEFQAYKMSKHGSKRWCILE